MATNLFNPLSGKTYSYNSWWDDDLWKKSQPTNGVNPYLQQYPKWQRPQPPAPPTTPVNPVNPVVPVSGGGDGDGGQSLPSPIAATMTSDGGLTYSNPIGGYGYTYGPGVYANPQEFMNETGIGDPEWDTNHPANQTLDGFNLNGLLGDFNPTKAQGLGLLATLFAPGKGLGPLVSTLSGKTDWGKQPIFNNPPFAQPAPVAARLSPGDSGYDSPGSASNANMREAGFSQEDQDFIESGFGDDDSSSSSDGGFSATDNGGGSYGGGADGGYSDAQSEADMGW